jgi:uncharacterized protein with HEPN domain
MSDNSPLIIHDRLAQILESIDLIQEWSKNTTCPDDFITSMDKVMVFNACVMRLQVIGEEVGKLLRIESSPLEEFNYIPWRAICDMRNLISHEYSNINEIVVFSTIKEDLPELRKVIMILLEKYQ